MSATAGLNFVTVKKNSKECNFNDCDFMVSDIANILLSLGLEATIVEIYEYFGTPEEKMEVLKTLCAAFPDNKEKKFVICTKACVSLKEFPKDKYYDPHELCSGIDEGKKPVPFDEVIARESRLLESAGFIDFNDVVGYECSKAYVYSNDLGKLLLDYSLNLKDDTLSEQQAC